jgi:localization factor PodJL
MIRMRPGVPWNVKGIEAEAREMAQLAARRNGVSLGEYLTQLIMTEGRPTGPVGHGYPQQQFMPGDGTYGPQPMMQPPAPSLRYPQVFPQGNPQAYAQPQPYQPLNPHAGFGPPQPQPQPPQQQPSFDSQIRGSEFQIVAHGLRDLADRLESSERRAQTAIATVNQSVAAMQDRIDAAERVKQLADVAFTSAADALAQSARDQASAFESLETTVRSVQKRLVDIESGRAEWPGKESVNRLETALTQLQKRLVEMEAANKPDSAQKDQFARLEITLNHLQKRLAEMETARGEFPHKDALVRLEASIAEVRHGVVDNEKRSREDLTQLARFMRELGNRVDAQERSLASGGGNAVTARLDSLEARSASMFDEVRGQLSAMDARIAQTVAKSSAPPEAFSALKNSVDSLYERFEQVGDAAAPMRAIESTLETLTTKIEDSERRAAESVSTVSNALKTISARLDETDAKQSQAMTSLTRRFEESERKTSSLVEDSMRSLTQRLEAADKKHREAIGGLRLTVDGLVAKAAAEAVPDPRQRMSSMPSALGTPFTPPPPVQEPYATSAAEMLSNLSSEPVTASPKQDSGLSVSALETIMATTLSPSSQEPSLDQNFDVDRFAPPPLDDDLDEPKKDDFLSQARRAAKAAAQADADRAPTKGTKKRTAGAYHKEDAPKSKFGRLVIVAVAGVAVIAGIVALLFTLPGGKEDGINRPGAGESIGEILNGPGQPGVATQPGPGAEFAPPSSPDAAGAPGTSVTAEPNGLGSPTPDAPPSFTSGTSMLPGSDAQVESVASLEAGAVRGDATSQLLLALRYAEGRGVEKDDAKALSLVTKAAQQGLVMAQYRLGAMYERGIGVPKDLMQAKTWYERAAKGGNRKAMHNLAVLFADGVGIGQSFQQAAQWFRQGAEYGLPDSQYNYAILLERGMGVDKNLAEAAKWYAIAASQGDAGAGEKLEALKKTMPAGDMKAAEDAARQYKPRPMDKVANELPSVQG